VDRTVGAEVAFERIYWDQASALVQVGLLDETNLPVTGVAQAEKVLDNDLPANELAKRGS
jgi:carboxymethylenebutenolidase